MKFRNKLYQYRVAAWDLHYIPYQQLKASLKAAKQNGQELSEDFYTSFVKAVVANTAFFVQRCSGLQQEEEQLAKQWEDGALGKHRPEMIYLNTIMLQEALIELLLFYRVNYEAVKRICMKLDRFEPPCSPGLGESRYTVHAHCEGQKQAFKESLDLLNRVQVALKRYQSNHSANRLVPYNLDQEDWVVAAIFQESKSMSAEQSGNGRTPLHFGATFNMINLCTHVLSKVTPVERYILLQDGAGFTPLHISVTRGHVQVAQLLLSAMDKLPTMLPDDLLHIALRHEDDDMVELLISRSVGLQHLSSSGESCLYIAAQIGREDYVRLLLPRLRSDFLDAAESSCQWTPLFISCVEGHASTVRLLMDAGADTNRFDYLGWTAQENAAFRGHIAVAEMFSAVNAASRLGSPLPNYMAQRKDVSPFDGRPGLAQVLINLGSLQERGASRAVTLEPPGTLGYGLVLSISTSERTSSIERMLPLFDDTVDDTLVFAIEDPSKTAIVFDMRRESHDRDDHGALIGTGLAFLYTQTSCLGAQHDTLLREQSVPILCKNTLRLLGTVTFSFLIVKPYYQLKFSLPSSKCFGGSSSVQLVGHRGLGQNSRERFLQLGENTVESFLVAGNQGASFVEFGNTPKIVIYAAVTHSGTDVQLTKDLVPVIFHDYSLSESGTDVPIHDVTLDQFMHVSSIQSPRANSSANNGSSPNNSTRADDHLYRTRSRSVSTAFEKGAEEVKTRMQHTVDYLKKGFKPNTRGDFVQSTFATLEDVLCKVPKDIGFDMEIKYPRIHEALEAGIAPVSININIFVDTILDHIARFGQGRNIILSSFTPEVCILLAIKQKAYPVLFITNAGKLPLSDKEKRAGSLQVAARFAKQWALAGIVVAADSLVMCPRLIDHVRSRGLVCGSYNGLNNEPENVELQVKAGIDLIVADRVGLISQTLKRMAI